MTDTLSILHARLEAATSSDNKHNNWPDKLNIIESEQIDISKLSPGHILELGMDIGASQSGVYRQIPAGDMPYAVHYPSNATMAQVTFVLKLAAGQVDDESTRNIIAYWILRDWKNNSAIVYRALLGCEHDYDTTGSIPIRGYNRGKCRKCGHSWMRDSGD